jgi:hypothetical protein
MVMMAAMIGIVLVIVRVVMIVTSCGVIVRHGNQF